MVIKKVEEDWAKGVASITFSRNGLEETYECTMNSLDKIGEYLGYIQSEAILSEWLVGQEIDLTIMQINQHLN